MILSFSHYFTPLYSRLNEKSDIGHPKHSTRRERLPRRRGGEVDSRCCVHSTAGSIGTVPKPRSQWRRRRPVKLYLRHIQPYMKTGPRKYTLIITLHPGRHHDLAPTQHYGAITYFTYHLKCYHQNIIDRRNHPSGGSVFRVIFDP